MVSITPYETAAGRRWRVRYRKPNNNHSTDKRGFKRRKDAEQWAAENVITARAEGTYVDPIKGKTRFGVIAQRWFDMHVSVWKPAYSQSVETDLRNHVMPAFANKAISSIRKSEVQSFVNELAADYSPTVVQRCFRIIKGVFETARDDGLIRIMRPVENVNLPSKPKRKEDRHYLTQDQLVRLADCSGYYRSLVLVLGVCGLRWGEAAALRVRDIDLGAARIHVRHTVSKVRGKYVEGTPKSHEVRDVPIPRKLIPILAEKMAGLDDDAHVFTDPDGKCLRYRSVGKGARGWWVHALDDAGLPHMVPHDLRHTAASIAVSSGANVKVLQHILGHKQAAMTLDTYADLFEADLDTLASSIDDSMPALSS